MGNHWAASLRPADKTALQSLCRDAVIAQDCRRPLGQLLAFVANDDGLMADQTWRKLRDIRVGMPKGRRDQLRVFRKILIDPRIDDQRGVRQSDPAHQLGGCYLCW